MIKNLSEVIQPTTRKRKKIYNYYFIINIRLFTYNKEVYKILDYINSLKDFIGFYPYYEYGTLCIFDNKDSATIGYKKIKDKCIIVGNKIGRIKVDKQYIIKRV